MEVLPSSVPPFSSDAVLSPARIGMGRVMARTAACCHTLQRAVPQVQVKFFEKPVPYSMLPVHKMNSVHFQRRVNERRGGHTSR